METYSKDYTKNILRRHRREQSSLGEYTRCMCVFVSYGYTTKQEKKKKTH